jgi:hypothetical protein
MPTLANQPGEFRFTVNVTRAATGETEIIEMVGQTAPSEDETHQSETQEK